MYKNVYYYVDKICELNCKPIQFVPDFKNKITLKNEFKFVESEKRELHKDSSLLVCL